MLIDLILISLGFFILYLIFDFLKLKSNINAFIDKWLAKTLWLWLPFYAFQRLIKEVLKKK